MAAKKPKTKSIVILNDEETYTSLQGCFVVNGPAHRVNSYLVDSDLKNAAGDHILDDKTMTVISMGDLMRLWRKYHPLTPVTSEPATPTNDSASTEGVE